MAISVAAAFAAAASRASAASFVVTTTTDAGPGTLRQAILDADATPGADLARFNIPGSGVRTIAVTSGPLPSVTEQLSIDGRTQPGFAGSPLVRVDNGTGSKPTGLNMLGSQSQVLGLEVTRFGVGVRIAADNTVVARDLIGTDAAGAAGLSNTTGVRVASGTGTRVGSTVAGGADTISGNSTGVEIVGKSSTATQVVGNLIGTDPTGVDLSDAGSSGNSLEGNSLGTDPGGTAALDSEGCAARTGSERCGH